METNSTLLTTAALGEKESSKRFLNNLKTNKKIHTHIFFILFLIYSFVSCLLLYNFGYSWLETFSGLFYIAYALGNCFAIGFLLFYLLYLKTKEEKQLFINYFVLLPLLCYAPVFYIDIYEDLMIEVKQVTYTPNILFLLGFCNINAVLIVFLGHMKKQSTLYGSLAYFFIFTGLIGGLLNTIGYPITHEAFEEGESKVHLVYKMFSNDYSHFPLWVFAIIILKEKWTKLNLVNVIWIAFYFLICYLWGILEIALFSTGNGKVLYNSAMFINEGLLGKNDKIFRFWTLAGLGIVGGFIVSLINELKFFPVNERFYKKRFNIFDTYWKQEQTTKTVK